MSDPRAFREERQALRARRIATRIKKAGGLAAVNAAASAIRIDAVCAPGVASGHVVAEPSKETLEHMAGFGFAVSEAAEGGATPPAPRPAVAPSAPLADAIAAGVAKALAALGIKAPAPAIDPSNAPPRNEDK